MGYLRLNWWKLFTNWGLNLAKYELVFVGIFFYRRSQESNMGLDRGIDILLIAPIVVAGIWTILMFLFNFLGFYIARSLFSDKTDRSLFPLWDNGSVEWGLAYSGKFFNYTQEYIKGYISGFPATMLYKVKTTQTSSSVVVVTFFVTDESSSTGIRSERREFLGRADFKFRIADIKPDILEFVEELKRKGYKPANEFMKM